jgi:hypothetical protein
LQEFVQECRKKAGCESEEVFVKFLIREKEKNENYIEQGNIVRGMVTFTNKHSALDFIKQANQMDLGEMSVRARMWRG